MKRSELVSQAYQILSTDDRYVGIRANSLSGVEACLEVFLDLGMLPPRNNVRYNHYRHGDDPFEYVSDCYEWDGEEDD